MRHSYLADQSPALNLTSQEIVLFQQLDSRILGERIRKARVDKKLSQHKLGGGEFTRAFISAIELGKARPTARTLAKFSQQLARPISYFLGLTDDVLPDTIAATTRGQAAQFEFLSQQCDLARQISKRADLTQAETSTDLGLAGFEPAAVEPELDSIRQANLHYRRARLARLHKHLPLAMDELTAARDCLPKSQPGTSSLYENELRLSPPPPLPVSDYVSLSVASVAPSDPKMQEILLLIEAETGHVYLELGQPAIAYRHYQFVLSLLSFRPLEAKGAPPAPTNTDTDETLYPHESRRVVPGNSPRLLRDVRLGLAQCRAALGEPDVAQAELEQVLHMFTQLVSDEANFYLELAKLYQERGEWLQASVCLGRAGQIYSQQAEYQAIQTIQAKQAQLHLLQANFPAAEQAAQRGLALPHSYSGVELNSNKSAEIEMELELDLKLSLVEVYTRQNRLVEAGQLVEQIARQLSQFQFISFPDTEESESRKANPPVPPHLALQIARFHLLVARMAVTASAVGAAQLGYGKALAIVEALPPATLGTLACSAPGLALATLYVEYGQQLRTWGQLEQAIFYLEKAVSMQNSPRLA